MSQLSPLVSLAGITKVSSVAQESCVAKASSIATKVEKASVLDSKLKNIQEGDIEYTANATNFTNGNQYQATLHLKNAEGNMISKGTKIVVSIPGEAVDYIKWVFSDTNLASLFDITPSKQDGKVTFVLKMPFSSIIIGPENSSYDVNMIA